jgi:hypothetical protein
MRAKIRGMATNYAGDGTQPLLPLIAKTVVMSFMDRLSNGWKLSMSSFRVLQKNKQLVIFPLLSSLALLVVVGLFLGGFLAANNWDLEQLGTLENAGGLALLFTAYLVNYFVIVFFNVALVYCARIYFTGQKPTVSQGLQFSISRLGAIFQWAIMAAVVGTLLRVVEEESGVVGRIISGIIGVVWSIATFFVVPVLAYENVSPFGAIKRSGQLMRKKWGESLAATFSFGAVQIIGLILVVVPLFLLGNLLSLPVGVALAVLGGFVIVAIVTAAQNIFISAVYHEVQGEPVADFDSETLDGIFMTRKT